MKPIYRYPRDERAAAVQPFVGKVCTVTYRAGAYSPFDRQFTGRVIGASNHATNGNSTGDLIVVPVRWPNRVYKVGDETWNAQSFGLANVSTIEEERDG